MKVYAVELNEIALEGGINPWCADELYRTKEEAEARVAEFNKVGLGGVDWVVIAHYAGERLLTSGEEVRAFEWNH
jgi:hypothetical protein